MCSVLYVYGVFFFFSSRRRHTRLQGDWSSDVCSSDLPGTELCRMTTPSIGSSALSSHGKVAHPSRPPSRPARSEERRVGKECRARGGAAHYKERREGQVRGGRGTESSQRETKSARSGH